MKNIYVVVRFNNGEIDSESVEIEGKVNNQTVKKAFKDNLSYPKSMEPFTVLSWQEEEVFTPEEQDEFWKTY